MDKAIEILFMAAALNFAVFGVVFFSIGGSAVGGKIENGRYFLHDKSRHVEASKFIFCYSYVHTIASAGMIAAVLGLPFVNEIVKIRNAYRT